MRSMLVTGAGAGIGEAVARAAAAAGFRVGVADIDAEAASEVAADLPDAVALPLDVTAADEVRATLAAFGDLDVVVNNAGILRTGPLIDHDVADFRRVMEVNINAVFIVAQAAAQRMAAGNGGVIINMASINGLTPSPNSGAYGTAKAGVIALTRQMAIEWGALGIRVNAIAPGFVDAGMSTPFYADDAIRERRSQAVPVGRLASAQDIADAALFLSSEQASYVSGHTLTVDGGVVHSVLAQLPRD